MATHTPTIYTNKALCPHSVSFFQLFQMESEHLRKVFLLSAPPVLCSRSELKTSQEGIGEVTDVHFTCLGHCILRNIYFSACERKKKNPLCGLRPKWHYRYEEKTGFFDLWVKCPFKTCNGWTAVWETQAFTKISCLFFFLLNKGCFNLIK